MNDEPTQPTDENLDVVDQVIDLLDDNERGAAIALISEMRAAEAAVVLQQLSEEDLAEVVASLDTDVVSSAIEFAPPDTRIEIARLLDAEALAETLEAVPDDIAADLVQEIDEETAAEAMEALSDERREEIEQLLTYGDETAGGRMTGQVITLPPAYTAADAIEYLRSTHADASKPFYLYVTDEDRTLLGVLNVRSLLTAPPERPITDLMIGDIVSVDAQTDQEEAAHVLQLHNLLALPVVDSAGRLLGTITSDDLIDVLEEEATEDIYRLALVHEDEDLSSVARSVKHRMPWLSVNLITAMAAAWVVSNFEGTLEQIAILAAFLPVIGGQGGNAGIQTLSVVIRSLAIGRISPRDTSHLLWHELRVGLILGLATGFLVGLVAWLWQGNPWLGFVVLTGLSVNITVGALAGVLIPMALQKAKQDPALSGGIWLTAATDLSGFFAFLLTASYLITRLD